MGERGFVETNRVNVCRTDLSGSLYGKLAGFWVHGTEHAVGNIVDWLNDCKSFRCDGYFSLYMEGGEGGVQWLVLTQS
jgi:hypothetical protein